MRKAKREGKESGYYLSIGTVHGAVVVVVVVVLLTSRLVLNVLVFTNHHYILHLLVTSCSCFLHVIPFFFVHRYCAYLICCLVMNVVVFTNHHCILHLLFCMYIHLYFVHIRGRGTDSRRLGNVTSLA